MIPIKVKDAIEASPELNEQLLAAGLGLDWRKFNRTIFDFLARRINRKVTQLAIAQPYLISGKLIVGKDFLEHLIPEQKLSSDDAVAQHLVEQKKLITWISGKTLHSYWNKGEAKETKLNVLLTYLNIPVMEWDDWKSPSSNSHLKFTPVKTVRKNAQQDLIKNYYLGSYHLYYQKSDNSKNLVKAPFVIGIDERGQIFAQTLTEGHPYRSSLIELRDGILYIHCENQVFDEKENHIFNVGNETNPEVLFGVSNTISVKKKQAIGIRNVLVRQKSIFTEKTFVEKEIAFDAVKLNDEETIVLKFFLQQTVNLINSQHCCPLSVLKEKVK
ncbi:MAG: hypothetical protein JNM57_16040 [Cyclobacteriaceae bacterium]|nr:hypothetical protein [Cyclobacteriaceae bacterium]